VDEVPRSVGSAIVDDILNYFLRPSPNADVRLTRTSLCERRQCLLAKERPVSPPNRRQLKGILSQG